MGNKKKKKRKMQSVELYKKYKDEQANVGIKYSKAAINMIYRLSLLGLTEREIAMAINIDERTLDQWKLDHPEVEQALLDGKLIADSRVAESMYQSALGYSHPDVHILSNRVKKFDEFGKVIEEYTEPLIVPIRKHYPPNVTAGKAWLAARQKALWGESTDININGEMNVHHEVSMEDLDTKELEMLEALGMKKLNENAKKALN